MTHQQQKITVVMMCQVKMGTSAKCSTRFFAINVRNLNIDKLWSLLRKKEPLNNRHFTILSIRNIMYVLLLFDLQQAVYDYVVSQIILYK